MTAGNGHIPSAQLALFSRGDLSFLPAWLVKRHIRRCDNCARLVSEFEHLQERMSPLAAELPEGMSEAAWRSLASEMTANIHVAMAAGECVSVRPRLAERPRLVFAVSGLALLILFACLERPQFHESSPLSKEPGFTLEASGNGIAVQGGGRLLSVSAPAGADVIQIVNTRGDVHSRYADDTGVTINAVYADAE